MDHPGEPVMDDVAARVRALESVLTERGWVDPAALDALVETYETQVGPRNGARVVARSWTDAEYRSWLLRDGTAAIASLGFSGRGGEHMQVASRTRRTCTTSSSARYAPATRGRCSGCRRSGTSPRPIGRARSPIRAACWRTSASRSATMSDPRVGLDRRAALPRAADAPGRHRGLGRGRARRGRHARLDDRDRPVVNGVHDMGGMDGSARSCPSPTSRSSMATGSAASSR